MDNPYQAPTAAERGATLVTVPGLEGRLAITAPGMLRGNQLLVDGQPAPRGSGWRSYALPDGREAKLRVELTRTSPTVIVDGASYVSGEVIPTLLVVLQFMPFLMVVLGGCVGGAAAGAAVTFNMAINRQSWTVPVKVAAILGVSSVAFVGWIVVAAAISLGIGR